MKSLVTSWQFWALLSAFFAALTAIFAKIGIANINSDFATFIRTIIILAIIAAILTASGEWQSLTTISTRTYVFLALSGAATGASWLCYFRAGQMLGAAPWLPHGLDDQGFGRGRHRSQSSRNIPTRFLLTHKS